MKSNKKNGDFGLINLDHFRQDVDTVREESFGRERYEYAAELIPHPQGNEQKIIEVGGGRAEFARFIRKLGYQVVFTDISENNVRKAKDLEFEAYVCDFNHGLSEFSSSSFKEAILLDVIEHIIKAEFLLREINRILIKGGFLILSTPNALFFRNRLRMLRGYFLVDEGYHYRFFTKEKLDQIIQGSSFYIEERNPTSSTLGLNKIRDYLGLNPFSFKLPEWLESLLVRVFIIRATKVRNIKGPLNETD